jgi:hypothetical protein
MLALAVLLPAPAAATVLAKGDCATNRAAYIVSDAFQSTMSKYSHPIAATETRVPFTQGGSKPGCIIVSFSAEATAAASETMLVTAKLDDLTDCNPVTMYFAVGGGTLTDQAARAMNFVCTTVAPGPHFVRMWFSGVTGGQVNLSARTTVVHYTK